MADSQKKHPAKATLPKAWRLSSGFSQGHVAKKAGLTGANPSRTYDRYESGECPCPAAVIEAVRKLSEGVVGAESWQRQRLDYLREHPSSDRRSPRTVTGGAHA